MVVSRARAFRRYAATLPALVYASSNDRAAAGPDPGATMERLARELDLQTKMPDAETPDIPWSSIHWHIPGTLAEWVMWGALAVGVAFALYALRDVLPRPGRRRDAPEKPSAVVLANRDAVARMTEAAEDADELARLGRFAEAMHVLLLHSLAEMRTRLGITIADSLTSREILRRLRLPERGRDALADLIARVEPVHFGRRTAGSTEYGECRSSFEALVAAMQAPA